VLSCTRGKKEATCSRTNLMDSGTIPVFTFEFFLLFQFCPCITHTSFSHFTQKNQKVHWPFSFPLKFSPFSPLQDHHHLRRFLRLWSFCVWLWLKVTPGFPKKWCFVEFKRCFGFVIFRLIWIMPHSWLSFFLSLFKTYDLLMLHSWVVFAYVISQTYDLWLLPM